MKSSSNIIWQSSIVTREERQAHNNHRGCIIWFTGLSGSGKSTLAYLLEKYLFDMGCQTVVLDGDNVRHGLCSDLSFSESDRKENIRRIGEIAKLFAEAGMITITAFISPFSEDRKRVRSLMQPGYFIETYVECPLEVCESRDVKGFYKKARAGDILTYTGISSPYEPPKTPECVINTAKNTPEECLNQLTMILCNNNIISIQCQSE